jgi:type II secretory pathway pseudopilin PulG
MVAELGRARSPRAGIKGPGGFTFVEVLAAMLFMSIVIPVAMQGIQIANRAGVVAARKSIAVQLADKLLNEAILTSNSRSSGQGGSFPDPHKDYRWRQSQKNWTEDTMREITVEVFYMVQNQEYSVALTTLVTQDTQ